MLARETAMRRTSAGGPRGRPGYLRGEGRARRRPSLSFADNFGGSAILAASNGVERFLAFRKESSTQIGFNSGLKKGINRFGRPFGPKPVNRKVVKVLTIHELLEKETFVERLAKALSGVLNNPREG